MYCEGKKRALITLAFQSLFRVQGGSEEGMKGAKNANARGNI